MFDVDKFIECVHSEPALWDKGSKDYSDKNCRDKSWFKIGENMFENWFELDSAERDIKVKDMKNKWRNIRDQFLKFVKQGKSGDPAPKREKYVYAEALSFLQNATETSGNVEESPNPDEEDYESQPAVGIGGGEEFVHTPSAPEPGSSNVQRKVSRKRTNLTSFQSELLKQINYCAKGEEDADKLFLLSLLPDYKKLNDEEKIDFKLMTINFFRNLRSKTISGCSAIGTFPQPYYNTSQAPPMDSALQFPRTSVLTELRPLHASFYTQSVPSTSLQPLPSMRVSCPIQSPSQHSLISSHSQVIDPSDSGQSVDSVESQFSFYDN